MNTQIINILQKSIIPIGCFSLIGYVVYNHHNNKESDSDKFDKCIKKHKNQDFCLTKYCK